MYLVNAATWICIKYRRRQLQGRQDLYEKLSPKYRFGCQRTGFASKYYPTFVLPNAKLEVSPIEKVTQDSIITSEGEEEIDVRKLTLLCQSINRYLKHFMICKKFINDRYCFWQRDTKYRTISL